MSYPINPLNPSTVIAYPYNMFYEDFDVVTTGGETTDPSGKSPSEKETSPKEQKKTEIANSKPISQTTVIVIVVVAIILVIAGILFLSSRKQKDSYEERD